MFKFLHSFEPNSILLTLGALEIYWYGLFMVLAIVTALLVSFHLTKRYQLDKDLIFDLSFWLIIGGLIGARLYEILLMLPFYLADPWQAIRIWEGGLAIHGGILAGLVIIYIFSRRHHLGFWKLGSVLAPGVALGQAIGRWGNYFNQELFGLPTNLPWGIPINPINRPIEFISETHFHPTFLYESFGLLLIFAVLYYANYRAARLEKIGPRFYLWSVCSYVILYSLLRFSLEYIRIDETPIFLGWRWPQIASLIMIAGSSILLVYKSHVVEHQSSR